MGKKQFNRRDLLGRGLKYGAGSALLLDQLAGVPLLSPWASPWLAHPFANRYDAYEMMRLALSGGPSILPVHRAMAQNDSDWMLVEIKVVNHIYAPMFFRLGKLENGVVTTDPAVRLASARMARAQSAIMGQGVDLVSDMPRYQALRFNKWFANMLHYGSTDGLPRTTSNIAGLSTSDLADLSADKVALQGFIGLAQIETNNHALKGLKLRSELPDITLFAQEKGLIDSPLGISCFMMGGNYDKAEGSLATNAVLGKSKTSEDAVVGSRTVADYVSQISQFVGKTYADRAAEQANLVMKLDMLVDKDPKLRRDLLASIEQFKASILTLESTAKLETAKQTINTAVGNTQSENNAEVGAAQEFLAQVKYVAQASKMPGQPVRNFSLFLNMSDLDQKDLDLGFSGGGGNASAVRALSYIEGTRQLAMGLNVLAKAIAEGSKMIVYVHSEGGRGNSLGDNKTGCALVMGPKGPGLLDDRLFAKMAAIDALTSDYLADPGDGKAAMPWDIDDAQREKDNSPSTGIVPTTGDVGMGVIQFLEERTGKDARADLAAADARYIKLKRA